MRMYEAYLVALDALRDKLIATPGREGPYDKREAKKIERAIEAFAFELGSFGYKISKGKVTTTLGHFTVYSAS